jgi:hypothetical protein
MIQNLTISEHNAQAHTDIEHDIEKQKKGLFTFILRIDNGNIVDYNVISYVDIRDYLVLKKVIIEEFTITHPAPHGSQQDTIRTDNRERTA